MTHGSLFSGIGGFDLAAEWSGWENLFNCEWEEFPRKVLKYHFPNAKQYGDIKEFDATDYHGRIDILSGGFPCQPFSVAGKQKGTEDERHLWPEMLRIIGECQPRWVVGENVRGICSWSNGLVLEACYSDLENLGYSVQSFIIPACATNAPHRRDRVWIVAHRKDHRPPQTKNLKRTRRERESYNGHEVRTSFDAVSGIGNASDTDGAGREKQQFATVSSKPNGISWGSDARNASDTDGELLEHRNGERATGERTDQEKRTEPLNGARGWETFPTVPPICGGDDGLSKELDGITFPKWRRESIKAYGNAIVPQVAYRIFQSINNYENDEP